MDDMTPDNGSENQSLNVTDAASKLEGMMGQEDSAQEQPTEAQQEIRQAQPNQQGSEEIQEVEQEQPQKFRVKAAGEDREVTLDELISGYALQADVTKKTQALAEQRKTVEAERDIISESKKVRDQYATRLKSIEEILTEQSKGPSFEHLKEEDPVQYAVKIAEQTQREKQLASVKAEQSRLAQQQQAERQQSLQMHISNEKHKLETQLPGYNQDKELQKRVALAGKNLGYSDQELDFVYDSRAVMGLWKAAEYDRLIGNRPEVAKQLKKAPKMVKPGVAQSRNSDKEMQTKLRGRLKKSGRLNDAVSVMETFLK